MPQKPLVSVIIIFLNATDFLEEAIESVLAQTYEYWELFLVDDGSTDRSTSIARKYAGQYPGKVVYLDHVDHANQGKGTSRNLGIRRAQGAYVAFLDADDIWLPNKLEQQVEIISSYPEAGMLYGDTLYWYSWTGNPDDVTKDFIPKLGLETNILIEPPTLLPLYLRGRTAVPCTCSVLVRRTVVDRVNGFDETCPGILNFYEDQAFYAKICLTTPVVVVDICWDKYRQRSRTRSEDIEIIANKENLARKSFLNWLDDYLTQCGIEDTEIRLAIRKELWLQHRPAWLPGSEEIQNRLRWIKKWILHLDEVFFPKSVQYRLWLRD